MKIKEGGGMDIQKVKELALANGFKLKEQASGNMDLNAYVYDFANAVEREVKAQSDQKIKLLLCDEHLKKCESPTGVFNSQYSDEEPCLICLAKQAKAQAVPEGYQLVKKELNAELMYAVAGTDDINEHLWIEQIYKGLLKAQEPTND